MPCAAPQNGTVEAPVEEAPLQQDAKRRRTEEGEPAAAPGAAPAEPWRANLRCARARSMALLSHTYT